ncbi:cytochrome P450 3A25-like isoform X2 [Mercenaria mercenaria]|uniref:cytochrome P450 3A25-like isoform X2 n=1 Tax=Mercenaria mercenaria TaxID=6596 RepID=UPI00234E53DF|nr:cytochrome P450 3A25-like isoform X2 [Mercenaria mercenaria]
MSLSLEVNPCLVLAFLGMCLAIIYRYMVDTYSTLERLGVPGPKPIWIFGNVLEFKGKNVLQVFDDWKKKFGSVYGFYEGFRPGIVVNDVDFAKDVLSRHFELFNVRTAFEKTRIASSRMLHQLSDDLKIATEGMNISKVIDSYVSEGVMRIVLDMDDEKLAKYNDSIYDYEIASNWSASAENEAAGLARLFPSLTPLLKLADRKHKTSHNTVVDILREHIDTTLTGQNNNKKVDDDNVSFLSFLLSSKVLCRELDGSLTRRGLTSDETIAHILSLLSEMYSTTTAMIQFILYELACNQNCQTKLYDEMCRICGKDGEISLAELQTLEYLDMLFNETYRHHPIAPGISRVCTETCKIRGVTFKKGMVVRVMTSPLYKDANLFYNPERFMPERFSKRKRLESHQYSFLPFGRGPRMCPGQKLAMIQVKMAIIDIIRNYMLTTCKHTEIPLKEGLRPSLTPANGVCISMCRRF